jgi:(2Fe-2S) ferredoxin
MPKFTKHIFICGNQRAADHPRGSCDPTGTGDLQRAFKARLAQTAARTTVRANKSGCLDQCEHGPTVVVYPEAVWYGHVTLADVEEIVQSHILGDQPVERLRIADACLNTATCEHRTRVP